MGADGGKQYVQIEPDARHVGLVLRDLGLEGRESAHVALAHVALAQVRIMDFLGRR